MIEVSQLDRLPGMDVVGSDDKKIGSVDEVYVDAASGEPTFALVDTGLFGLQSSFIPLERAEVRGEELRVAYDKERVKDAPTLDPQDHLNPWEEEWLYRYYDLPVPVTPEPSVAKDSDTADEVLTSDTAGSARAPHDESTQTPRLRRHVIKDESLRGAHIRRQELARQGRATVRDTPHPGREASHLGPKDADLTRQGRDTVADHPRPEGEATHLPPKDPDHSRQGRRQVGETTPDIDLTKHEERERRRPL